MDGHILRDTTCNVAPFCWIYSPTPPPCSQHGCREQGQSPFCAVLSKWRTKNKPHSLISRPHAALNTKEWGENAFDPKGDYRWQNLLRKTQNTIIISRHFSPSKGLCAGIPHKKLEAGFPTAGFLLTNFWMPARYLFSNFYHVFFPNTDGLGFFPLNITKAFIFFQADFNLGFYSALAQIDLCWCNTKQAVCHWNINGNKILLISK